MRVPIAVLAENANVAQGGNLNIFGIFDQISSTEVPTLYPHATLVVSLVFTRAEQGQSGTGE